MPVVCAAITLTLLVHLKFVAITVASLVGLSLWIYIDFGFFALMLDLAAGKKGSPGRLFTMPRLQMLNFFLVNLLVVLGFVAGSILLLVPGIYFLSRFCLAVPMIVGQNKSIVEALSGSLKMTKGSVKALMGVIAICTGLGLITNFLEILSCILWFSICYFFVQTTSESGTISKPQKPGILKAGAALVCLPVSVILSLVITFIGFRCFVEARYIPSSAMEPTLAIGDRILLEKSFRFGLTSINRGDILVFYPPPSELAGKDLSSDPRYVLGRLTGLPFLPYEPAFIKRAIGLPGDTIRIERGVGVYVNDKLLQKPYSMEKPNYDLRILGDIGMTGRVAYKGRPSLTQAQAAQPIVVGKDQLFVLADNINNSQDSHVWGFLDRHRVIGRAWLKIYPEATFF